MSSEVLSYLSPRLFWDANLKLLNVQEHKAYIIKRVLEFGEWNEYLKIKEFYGFDTIVKVALDLRDLDDLTLNFISVVSGRPKEEFRCYKLRSYNQKHWIY